MTFLFFWKDLDKSHKKLIRQTWRYYLGYCKDNGEIPFKSFKNSFFSRKFEMFRKAILYAQHHKLNWNGDDIKFLKYYFKMSEEHDCEKNREI